MRAEQCQVTVPEGVLGVPEPPQPQEYRLESMDALDYGNPDHLIYHVLITKPMHNLHQDVMHSIQGSMGEVNHSLRELTGRGWDYWKQKAGKIPISKI